MNPHMPYHERLANIFTFRLVHGCADPCDRFVSFTRMSGIFSAITLAARGNRSSSTRIYASTVLLCTRSMRTALGLREMVVVPGLLDPVAVAAVAAVAGVLPTTTIAARPRTVGVQVQVAVARHQAQWDLPLRR